MDERKVCLSFNALALFRYFALINIFVFTVLAITGTSLKIELIVLGLVDVSYIASLTFKRLPTKILVDQKLNVLIIEFLKYLIHKEKKQYNINELTCSYKEEMRAKGVIVNVLRISNTHGIILELIPNYNGWSESKLKEIFEALQPK